MPSTATKQRPARRREVPPAPQSAAVAAELSGPAVQPPRHEMIAEAAFFIAQARGFEPHHELDDWLAAERELGHQLSTAGH